MCQGLQQSPVHPSWNLRQLLRFCPPVASQPHPVQCPALKTPTWPLFPACPLPPPAPCPVSVSLVTSWTSRLELPRRQLLLGWQWLTQALSRPLASWLVPDSGLPPPAVSVGPGPRAGRGGEGAGWAAQALLEHRPPAGPPRSLLWASRPRKRKGGGGRERMAMALQRVACTPGPPQGPAPPWKCGEGAQGGGKGGCMRGPAGISPWAS